MKILHHVYVIDSISRNEMLINELICKGSFWACILAETNTKDKKRSYCSQNSTNFETLQVNFLTSFFLLSAGPRGYN